MGQPIEYHRLSEEWATSLIVVGLRAGRARALRPVFRRNAQIVNFMNKNVHNLFTNFLPKTY